jgi:hypothetical protein
MKIILSVLCCWLFVNISVLRKKKQKQKQNKRVKEKKCYQTERIVLIIS